ncbi:MAG: hypothetical protein J6S85_00940 [Methanobrevibacter sp.]|nr:hypothetical protein [Methanobrevibacter sp.]MBO7712098.1 hypothetical protein [Methanobrevibacter sp.]
METNKIYCKLENNVIKSYFICFAKEPKYKAMAVNNFDESKDFENAVVIDSQYLDLIHVGFSKVENGVFVENKQDEILENITEIVDNNE